MSKSLENAVQKQNNHVIDARCREVKQNVGYIFLVHVDLFSPLKGVPENCLIFNTNQNTVNLANRKHGLVL